MSAMEINGSALVAMCGKNCVGIASDRRFGVQQQTVACNMKRLHKMHDKLFVGLSGLATDVHSVSARLKARLNMYRLQEGRDIKPLAFTHMLCSMLYQKRFGPWFVEPLVAGLTPTDEKDEDGKTVYKPFVSGTDLIGAPVFTDDFVVVGTAEDNLYGTCESMYRPDLGPDELFETIAQALTSAVDRNCPSGWGGVVYIITPDKIIKRELDARMD